MGVQKKTRKFAEVKRVIGKNDARRKENLKKAEEAVEKAKKQRRGGPDGETLLPLLETMMDSLLATCHPTITDCVMAELEKLGPKYRIAMRVAKDPRWHRITCTHKGIYADDCLTNMVTRQQIYIVATNDRGLMSRIRKVPGVPLLKCARGKYIIERLPGAPE
ncbi:rRNA-processing protein FCF1-like protein [Colletotrichum spinosum]|uniref:rRNA-processing protein FCF1-like protein n=1 Tax=Colletotrichum spinosum TaxID=1347390 RepID=A0A4V3HS69_9PEZI|nr:rRNA-processing protein FCF1-like protein [Colletotrichum spinosum]